jgi:uncharacterized RDD family membrane protein YckC
MKCPKCLYIGFETGDRCKNCGYDFSLLAAADVPDEPEDLPLRATEPDSAAAFDMLSAVDDAWAAPSIDRFRDLDPGDEPAPPPALAMSFADVAPTIEPAQAPPVSVAAVTVAAAGAGAAAEPALPLFAPDAVDDEPLVKLPVSPRAPLSVRKTPDTPRLRRTPAFEPPTRLHEDAVLQFVEEPEGEREARTSAREFTMAGPGALPSAPPKAEDSGTRSRRLPAADPDISPLARRFTAAVIDHGILLSIDLVVIYFTLRLTEVPLAEWRLLPMLPLAAFLLSLKVAYLSAFTTAGGQTIGKMATHIRVVADDGGRLDPGRALRRAVLGLVSIATAGAPFLTALSDPARRGAHDRASGTRVVALSPR